MSGTFSIFKTLGYASGAGIVGGGVSAGLQAAAGKAGAALLQSYEYAGYNQAEAVEMGVYGGAIVGGSLGIIGGALASFGINSKSKNKGADLVGAVASSVLMGLAGYGVMNLGSNSTEMSLGQTSAAFAVGASIVLIPYKL